jgi:O-antigen chain-terminating methyltransferase
VTEQDVLSYLRTLETASISAVSAFHIIEHLPFNYLVRLLNEVMRVLRPAGLVLFETPNPENVLVGSNFFYFDPSHHHPLPSSLMELLLETRGFAEIEIKNLHPWDSGRVQGRGELAERFNGLFYGPMDYAILGWKPHA